MTDKTISVSVNTLNRIDSFKLGLKNVSDEPKIGGILFVSTSFHNDKNFASFCGGLLSPIMTVSVGVGGGGKQLGSVQFYVKSSNDFLYCFSAKSG